MSQLSVSEAVAKLKELHKSLLLTRFKCAMLKSSTLETEDKLRRIEALLETAADLADELLPNEQEVKP